MVALGLVYSLTNGTRRGPSPAWPLQAGITVAIGVLAVFSAGGEALFVVSLPLYWNAVTDPRASMAWSGGGAVLAVLPGIWFRWTEPGTPVGLLVVVAAFLAGTGLGVWAHRVAAQETARADRLGRHLNRARDELAEIHLRQGAAEERERLAREIHDTLAQGFASIAALAAAARGVVVTDSATVERRLRSIEATARENLAEARTLVESGDGEDIGPAPVAPALRRAVERFVEDTGITVGTELADAPFSRTERLALVRCAQESLANVRRHAGAATVTVTLAVDDDGAELEIVDDGRGFDTAEAEGFGLAGMARRMAELSGLLTITSSPGTGTRLSVWLPRAQEDSG